MAGALDSLQEDDGSGYGPDEPSFDPNDPNADLMAHALPILRQATKNLISSYAPLPRTAGSGINLPLMAAAGAMLSPTRSGSFAESLGNAASEAVPAVYRDRQFRLMEPYYRAQGQQAALQGYSAAMDIYKRAALAQALGGVPLAPNEVGAGVGAGIDPSADGGMGGGDLTLPRPGMPGPGGVPGGLRDGRPGEVARIAPIAASQPGLDAAAAGQAALAGAGDGPGGYGGAITIAPGGRPPTGGPLRAGTGGAPGAGGTAQLQQVYQARVATLAKQAKVGWDFARRTGDLSIWQEATTKLYETLMGGPAGLVMKHMADQGAIPNDQGVYAPAAGVTDTERQLAQAKSSGTAAGSYPFDIGKINTEAWAKAGANAHYETVPVDINGMTVNIPRDVARQIITQQFLPDQGFSGAGGPPAGGGGMPGPGGGGVGAPGAGGGPAPRPAGAAGGGAGGPPTAPPPAPGGEPAPMQVGVDRPNLTRIGQTPGDVELNKKQAEEVAATHQMHASAEGLMQGVDNALAALEQYPTNWSGEYRLALGQFLIGGLGVDPKVVNERIGNVSSGEVLTKEFFKIAADRTRQLGAREPGFVLQAFQRASPNIELQKDSNKALLHMMRQDALRQQDMADEMQAYWDKRHSLTGFDEYFKTAHPTERYLVEAYRDAGLPVQMPAAQSLVNSYARFLHPGDKVMLPDGRVRAWKGAP